MPELLTIVDFAAHLNTAFRVDVPGDLDLELAAAWNLNAEASGAARAGNLPGASRTGERAHGLRGDVRPPHRRDAACWLRKGYAAMKPKTAV